MGLLKNKNMDIFEEIHNEFINSEDYLCYLNELYNYPYDLK
jgi:hypothetical protein